MAISKVMKEIKIMFYPLQGIGFEMELLNMVKAENIDAIFMAQNSSGLRTRHVDTWYHFIRESVEEGTIKIEFVKASENDSNNFSKNASQETYELHLKTVIGDTKEDYWRYPLRSILD